MIYIRTHQKSYTFLLLLLKNFHLEIAEVSATKETKNVFNLNCMRRGVLSFLHFSYVLDESHAPHATVCFPLSVRK